MTINVWPRFFVPPCRPMLLVRVRNKCITISLNVFQYVYRRAIAMKRNCARWRRLTAPVAGVSVFVDISRSSRRFTTQSRNFEWNSDTSDTFRGSCGEKCSLIVLQWYRFCDYFTAQTISIWILCIIHQFCRLRFESK